MSVTRLQSLDPLMLSLQGTSLIEASAGTGKTYTLAAIYLRLLLGLGQDKDFLRPLSVKEILVVTFTEAATKELRGRIRLNIHLLRLACLLRKSEVPLISALLEQIKDTKLAASQLLAAERQMDEAAIFTIHGFCQRMLNHSVVEFGMLFQQTILENEVPLLQQVSADFWRRYFYPLPVAVTRMIKQYWDGPESLLAELLPYLQGQRPLICNPPDKSESIITRHERIIIYIKELKQQWHKESPKLQEFIKDLNVNQQIYSSKNLLFWLDKIGKWAIAPTEDYLVPNELERFRSSVLANKTKKNISIYPPLFEAIETFYHYRLSLYELVFVLALDKISLALEQEKRRRAEISFDDLLIYFDRALVGERGELLAQSVRNRYPVAMVDEFQDTNPQQYRIFSCIYGNQLQCGLILIGDPKQAIYAFRGADVFTYMRAREEITVRYTLNTNWRSAPGMINAVNQLFQSLPEPFIFSQIPFLPVNYAASNKDLCLVIHQQRQPAMRLWLQPGQGTSISDYQHLMAHQCATILLDWLSAAKNKQAWLENYNGRRFLKASDITILVRNRREASLIRDALATLSIPTVYLSNRDSVYKTPEARELVWLLQAVLMPDQDNILRCAMATRLIGFDAIAIENFNTDVQLWEKLVEEFTYYRLNWQKHGVLPMLREIMVHYHTAENLLASINGKRRLTDLLHLGELLQEASLKLENEYSLVRWLDMQIKAPNSQADNQKLRLESDSDLVQIVTVHKSKGLEFPLVFLPFAANFRQQKRPLFHDRQQYQVWLDLRSTMKSLVLAEEERLAEDLRLLYVAVTRSIYHCSIGIAPIFHGARKKVGNSDLHHNALGYLIQQKQAGESWWLHSQLAKLITRSSGDIELCHPSYTPVQPLVPSASRHATNNLAARVWLAPPRDPWQVTSYSSLQRRQTSIIMDFQPRVDVDMGDKIQQQVIQHLTPHTFARSALSGTFLHGLLEMLDFTQPLDSNWLEKKLAQNNINAEWLPVIQTWIENIIHTPLDNNGLCLSRIAPSSRHTELQFYLPIQAIVTAQALDQLCRYYDPLSATRSPLDFPQIQGMLKGFIDLVFFWHGRYYLLDYKSNWLGEDTETYTTAMMAQAMALHNYDLQYQLYTLALHRYLRHRLVNYDYKHHFGGIYYLFLRGMDGQTLNNGVYAYRPDMELINGIDQLFRG